MAAMTIELPESVTEEINERRIPPQQVRAFVVEAVEAWPRMLATPGVTTQEQDLGQLAAPSRFADATRPFIEKLLNENRTLFEEFASF